MLPLPNAKPFAVLWYTVATLLSVVIAQHGRMNLHATLLCAIRIFSFPISLPRYAVG